MKTKKSESLSEFLRRKKIESEAQKRDIDWDARRSEWLADVDNLYVQIRKWLKDAIDEKSIEINLKGKDIAEDFIGQYSVEKLELKVGEQVIVFEPIGTLIMGAKGRIDVQGPNGPIMLILQDDGWKIGVRDTYMRHWPLTSDSFDDLLRQALA